MITRVKQRRTLILPSQVQSSAAASPARPQREKTASENAGGSARRPAGCGPRGVRPSTYPPLLVLLPCDDNHFPLREGELIVIVRLAVVDGLHSPHLVLPLQDRNGALAREKDMLTLGAEPQLFLCQGGGPSARRPGAVCSLSSPSARTEPGIREGTLPIIFTGKQTMGGDRKPASPKPLRLPALPRPQQQLAEMTAESKNGFGKHDVKKNVQLLHTECTA